MLPGEPALFVSLVCVPFAFAVALAFLRHAPLALLIALAPLPGLAVELLLRMEITNAYAFGFCAGLLMADVLLRHLLTGAGDWRWVAAGLAGAAGTAASFDWQYALVVAVWGLLGCAAAAAGFHYLTFGEAFIARANRAAEGRARLLETAAAIAVPRWAMALCGIGLVMASLAWFEIAHPAPVYPGFVVAAATAFIVARDWRAALAAALCAALLWLADAAGALPFFALAVLPLCAAARTRSEEGALAWRRTLEEDGAGLLFAAFGGAFLSALATGGLTVAVAFAVALLLFPALAVALWSLFPRRRSVEDMYGR